MQILTEINKSIEWLKANITSSDLLGKSQEVDRLALNSYYLATLVADWHEKMNTSEYMYKSSIASFISSSDLSVAKADAAAKLAYKDMWGELVKNENMYKRLQLSLAQANVIIEQGRQSISTLKQERRFENHG